MSLSKICLILGSGQNIGAAIARRFSDKGYKVATVSRSVAESQSNSTEGYLQIKANLSDPSAYPGIFSAVKKAFGGIPSTVVFNAAALSFPEDPANIFSLPLESLQKDFDLQVKGAFAAARETYTLWTEQNDGEKKTFILTGNPLTTNIAPVANLVSLGVTKNAAVYWVGLADKLYQKNGFR
jgi:NAD(P)-dependent dehydrogenase (short-subunit alcohol dehydrogenase family)